MGKIPITIEKIKTEDRYSTYSTSEIKETTKYLFKLIEKGNDWEKTFICDRADLINFQKYLTEILDSTTTAEALKITNEQAEIVDQHYKEDPLCNNCKFKLSFKCTECLFVLQSPLERKLFLEFSSTYLRFQIQYGLNWRGEHISVIGKEYNNPSNNFREVLTIVDFYFEKGQRRLCLYTDGHTYHERTEEQAQRDRNIDRKLQELGYTVLRYTGKDVLETPSKIIGEVKRWFE